MDNATSVGTTLLSLLVILQLLTGLLSVAAFFRRKPSIDQDLRLFATKKDLSETEARLRSESSFNICQIQNTLKETFSRINHINDQAIARMDEMKNNCAVAMRALVQEVGKAQGKLESKN